MSPCAARSKCLRGFHSPRQRLHSNRNPVLPSYVGWRTIHSAPSDNSMPRVRMMGVNASAGMPMVTESASHCLTSAARICLDRLAGHAHCGVFVKTWAMAGWRRGRWAKSANWRRWRNPCANTKNCAPRGALGKTAPSWSDSAGRWQWRAGTCCPKGCWRGPLLTRWPMGGVDPLSGSRTTRRSATAFARTPFRPQRWGRLYVLFAGTS